MSKRLTIELIEKHLKGSSIPETKYIGNGLYEYKCGNYIVRGNEQIISDIDKQILKNLGIITPIKKKQIKLL